MPPCTRLGCQILQQEVMLPSPRPWAWSRELGSLREQLAIPGGVAVLSEATFLLSSSTVYIPLSGKGLLTLSLKLPETTWH